MVAVAWCSLKESRFCKTNLPTLVSLQILDLCSILFKVFLEVCARKELDLIGSILQDCSRESDENQRHPSSLFS